MSARPRRPRWCAMFLALAAAVATAACGGDDPFQPMTGGIEPTLATIQTQIFTPRCALSGCHAAPDPQLGLNLSDGNAHDNLVDVPSFERPDLDRVEPGSAAASYLYLKITGSPEILGDRMPLGGPPLGADEIEAIRLWIEAGAPAS